MKKILYVINADWYFDLHWLDRAKAAINEGYIVSVALPTCTREYEDVFNGLGIKVYLFHMTRSGIGLFSELKAFRQIFNIIKDLKPSVVHSVTIKPNLYSTIANTLLKTPFICTFAGLGTLKTSTKFSYRLVLWLCLSFFKVLSRKAKLLATFENQDDLDFFMENKVFDENQVVRVFGAGVDLKKYIFSIEDPVSNSIKILFASRLLKDKGLGLLIEAVKKINNEGMSVELLVAGIFDPGSPLSFTLEEIEGYSDSGDIVWLGKRDDIPELIRQSSMVVLPTTYGEGVPRILIEACCVGRPIITTPLGGCKDICHNNENGILIEPNSLNELVAAIKALAMDKSLRVKYGENGRNIVECQFSNSLILMQNNEFYEMMAN